MLKKIYKRLGYVSLGLGILIVVAVALLLLIMAGVYIATGELWSFVEGVDPARIFVLTLFGAAFWLVGDILTHPGKW